MIITLIHPPTRNWLLIADDLNDPQDWSRFIPCHSADSERFLFESAVRGNLNAAIKVKLCKELLERGRSVFEYDWELEESTILAHALETADRLNLELSIGDPDDPVFRGVCRTAA